MSRFFIDRPIFAWVLSIVIVISGLACVYSLPIAQYPPIVPPTIQVTATFPARVRRPSPTRSASRSRPRSTAWKA